MSSSTTKKSISKKASQKKADPKQRFTLFPKLPLELRCKVWKYALPGPRYIEIRSEKAQIGLNYRNEQWSPFCTEKAPAIFFVCKESRAETLRSYASLKGTQPGTPAVYCDFETDILCVISKCFNYAFFPEFVKSLSNHTNSIRHILTDGSIFGWMLDEYFTENFDALTQFSSLKEVSLVSYLEEEFQNPDMNFVEDELFTIHEFKKCSSEDPHKSCMGIVREFYGKAIASKKMCLVNEGMFEMQMMKEGFTRAEQEHPGWNAPSVNCGLLIFIDQRGVRWAKCHGRWRCSADERISIRPNVEFENDCRADEFECGPYHNIRTPEFDMRLSSQHFPCKHNTYYSRDTL